MGFAKTTWVEGSAPGISAAQLNRIETGIFEACPVGVVLPYAAAAAPTGWLICDGASVSTTTYADLFAAIGYQFGGSGAAFNLPNLKGRVPVGLDTGQTEFNVRGETGGSKTHTLTASEMPAHSHTVNSHDHGAAGAHIHGMNFFSGNVNNPGGAATSFRIINDAFDQFKATESDGNHVHSAQSPGTNSQGSGAAHQNMPPYIALHYIIRY
jgi:microcystin-dependent protein